MANINERANAALAEIDALPIVRRSTNAPHERDHMVGEVLKHVVFDWVAVDGALFPDGNPLKLDLTDPAVRSLWKAVRTQQRAIAGKYFDAWDGKSNLVFEEGGLSADISLRVMNTIDPVAASGEEAFKIMQRYFDDPWTERTPTMYRRRSSAVLPAMPITNGGEPTNLYRYLQIQQRNDVLGHLSGWIPDRCDPTAISADTVRAALQALAAVDWVSRGRSLRKDLRRSAEMDWQARATVKRKNAASLADFLQARLDKARLHFDPSTAREQFTQLAMIGARPKQGKTNRTWGIELEIIDAGAIAFDAAGGWRRERDGSLRQQIGDGRTYDPWEFVSPILDQTYSPGLWMICDQAQHTVKYHKAGVHVHVAATTRRRKQFDKVTGRTKMVGGERMTTSQVSRLIELYATVSPLLDPIIARTKTREFCTPTRVDQWAEGWYEAPTSKKRHRVRPMRTRRDDAIQNAKFWAQITQGPNHDAEATNWKRHQELNLQALNKYGTIEFRSMGAVYDYEYLTRWAWLCRAMVDYAQSDAPMAAIYRVTDFNSLVLLLNQYSGEPLNLRSLAKRAA